MIGASWRASGLTTLDAQPKPADIQARPSPTGPLGLDRIDAVGNVIVVIPLDAVLVTAGCGAVIGSLTIGQLHDPAEPGRGRE